MKKLLTTLLTATTFSAILFGGESPRSTVALEDGWKFAKGDFPDAEKSSFDDSKWDSVKVPHDWAIDKPFDMNIDMQYVQVIQDGDKRAMLRTGRTGALPCFGAGWYRNTLDIPADKSGLRVFVEFDGAMSNAQIFVNGQFAGTWPYGYASFSFDITKFVKFGEKNLLAVRLDNKEQSSRWYSGAGLYRNVRLVYKSPTHVAYCGTFVTTPKIAREKASVSVKTDIVNPAGAAKIVHKIYAPDGKLAASAESENVAEEIFIDVPHPQLWDVKSPNLYRLETSLFDKNGAKIDRYTTRFGIRKIEITRDGGFVLNGRKTAINGVCMHHDLGPIGAATNVRALKRQLETLKEMGCNAIRTSHNPPSPELLDLCDEMGFIVEDEAFDEWRHQKCENGYHKLFNEWAEKDLTAFVKRDRNHPCVALWSIGNEVNDQRFPDGGATAKFLVDIVHRFDPTRPVTAGINNIKSAFEVSKIPQELDVVGLNYQPFLYAKYAKEYPNMIFHGSETASTVSSRGSYHFPVKRDSQPYHEDYQVSSYDTETPPWAQIPDEEFAALDENPTFFGEFVWTGYDYLGEPTPYNPGTPARSSYFGIVDLAGFKKDRFYAYQARWNPDVKVLHVMPHWNWEDRLGQNVPVHVYTNYPKAELFVNGKSMGVRTKNLKSKNVMEKYRMIWNDVSYQAGEIRVVAYGDDGKAVEEKTVKTAGRAATFKMSADRDTLLPDPKELIFVEIDIVDKDGTFCPRAANFMFVKVEGAGKLRALCNGDATDQTAFSSNYMKSFNGKLLAVVEPTGESGDVKITAYGHMLAPKTLTLKIQKPIETK